MFCRDLPAQTDVPKECLVPAGSVPLEGVEGRLDHLTADSASRRLFVAALENHSVEVIDLAKRQRVQRIAGILEPQGLVFIPGVTRLIAACRGDGTCRSFDANSLEEGPWIDLGRNADNVRFDAQSATIFVGSGAEPGPGLMSAIDLVSLLPAQQGGKPASPKSGADLRLDRPRQADARAQVELPSHPESFQLDPAKHRLYVNVPDEHQIAVVDVTPSGLQVSARWPVTVAEKNFPMTLDTANDRLYIACRKPPCLTTYDTHAGRMLSQTPCVGDSDDVFFDAKARRIYVIGGEGFVDVFRAPEKGEDPARLQRVSTVPRARTGLFMPDLRLLAVAVPHGTNGPSAILLFEAR